MEQKLTSHGHCPVCGSGCVEEYLNTNLTTFFFPLPEDLIHKSKKEPFKLDICQKCSFIFQVDVNMDLIALIYNDFYKHYNLDTSVEFQEVYRGRTIDFMEEILKQENEASALDLGCGEGTYFPFFESLNYRCYGIEPSEKAVIAKEKNPNATILHKYFETLEANEFNIKFDVILMNWVLEHISDIDPFFEKLDQYLKKGTKLIIQVPDIKYYIDNQLPLFYVHEHINYFTNETLTILLERKGFKIIGSKFGTSPALLICGEYTGIPLIKEVNNSELFNRQKQFLLENNDLKAKISKIISENKKVVFYGMGLLAFWIGENCLEKDDLRKVELVDDNIYYKGKLVPMFNKKLHEFPDGHNFDDTLILICTSPVYHEKIKNAINQKYAGDFKIASVKDNELVIE